MSKYRIENRPHRLFTGQPILYWREGDPGAWMRRKENATVFSEAERTQFLARAPGHVFPGGGTWVIIDEPEHVGDLLVSNGANSKNEDARHCFTVFRLRPVVIRLSVTPGEFADLNAQVDEFEAVVRQFIRKQQVLCGPEWEVDIQTEEE